MDAYTVDLYQLRWSIGARPLQLKCSDRRRKDYVLSGEPTLRPSRATVLQMATGKEFRTSEHCRLAWDCQTGPAPGASFRGRGRASCSLQYTIVGHHLCP